MSRETSASTVKRIEVILAYAAIYLIWGSTYLAILFAIETIPPFLMAGMRFLIAGSILLLWMRVKGAPAPTARQWKSAWIIGFLLLTVGNGALSWAEQRVPSGIAALIIASIPAMVVFLEFFLSGVRPSWTTAVGLVLGSVGTLVLVDPARLTGAGGVDLLGTGVLLVGSLSWAYGSLYSRSAPQASPPLHSTGMQMFSGGAALLLIGILTGELADVSPGQISILSVLSVAYLVIFGSLIAFSSYIWLLKVSAPARVSTYAFVNPVIALFLGWVFAGEELNARILVASLLTVVAVAMIVGGKHRYGKVRDQSREQH